MVENDTKETLCQIEREIKKSIIKRTEDMGEIYLIIRIITRLRACHRYDALHIVSAIGAVFSPYNSSKLYSNFLEKGY